MAEVTGGPVGVTGVGRSSVDILSTGEVWTPRGLVGESSAMDTQGYPRVGGMGSYDMRAQGDICGYLGWAWTLWNL